MVSTRLSTRFEYINKVCSVNKQVQNCTQFIIRPRLSYDSE